MLALTIIEALGLVSFAVSGAMTAIDHDLDIFGVLVLAVTTALGGGLIRDLILGVTPPAMFVTPLVCRPCGSIRHSAVYFCLPP